MPMTKLNRWTLAIILLVVIIVIGGIIVVLFLMKRFSIYGGAQSENNLIKMLASFSLAPRERVVLLDVQG